MARFPTVETLAVVEQEAVLSYWSGLGYYARARNLHKAAQIITSTHAGVMPDNVDDLLSLPGIGKSTAHAILSIVYQQPLAICDGNVKRVLSRWYALDLPVQSKAAQDQLWQWAQLLQSEQRAGDYTQAIMDLGAMLCTRTKPKCDACPIAADCQAYLSAHPVVTWPIRQAKKSKPVRETSLTLFISPDQHVWLMAPKSDSGLWGGLYQLPAQADCTVFMASPCPLPSFKHEFTHFSLQVSAQYIYLSHKECDELTWQGLWYNPKESNVPRPAVVDKVIQLWYQARDDLFYE